MKKFKDMEKFSYFKKGVNTATPTMDTHLGKIYAMIRSFRLKELTENIREGLADKTKVLPSVTFSGTFYPRCDRGLKAYSTLICMDVDHQDFPQYLMNRICWDRFLNPCLIFISPRGHGLKIIIRIKDGLPENHGLYFDAIALYLKDAYDIDIDGSGRNISRLCFICHDPEPFFFEDGFVTAEELLQIIPAPVPTPDRFPKPVKCENHSRDAINRVSTTAPCAAFVETLKNRKTTTRPHDDTKRNRPLVQSSGRAVGAVRESPSDQLNKIPAVHQMAVEALKRGGWQPKTDILWTRPGKRVQEGHSAKYSIYGPDGIYFLRNFSSEAPHFSLDKSYTDVGIICELDYSGDFQHCISDLAGRFLEQPRSG